MSGRPSNRSTKRRSELPFARAYDCVMADPQLSAAEKLVIFEVCRYFPRPYYGSARTIALHCGLSRDYVRGIIFELISGPKSRKKRGKPERRPYLKRGLETKSPERGTFETVRVLVPAQFPPGDGAAIHPPPCCNSTTPLGDMSAPGAAIAPPIREGGRTKEETGQEGDASPLPAEGQASASQKPDPAMVCAATRRAAGKAMSQQQEDQRKRLLSKQFKQGTP